MDTIRILARIAKKEIIYVNSLIEAYEGMAVMRTVNAERGLIEFQVSPHYLDDMQLLLKALSREISISLLKTDEPPQTKQEPSSP